MIKYCPIMSFRQQSSDGIYCMGISCELWDEIGNQCCLKTQALAAVADPLDRVREQAMYVPARPTTGAKPQDYRFNGETTGIPVEEYIFNGGL